MAIYFGDGSGGGDSTEGRIIQTQLTSKSATFSSNSDSFVDITGFYVDITPHHSGNKILFIATLAWGTSIDGYSSLQLLRDSTALGVAPSYYNQTVCSFALQANDNARNKLYNATYTFLDSPNSTSTLRYKLQCRTYPGDNRYFTLNRTYLNHGSYSYHHRAPSRLIAMEVAA